VAGVRRWLLALAFSSFATVARAQLLDLKDQEGSEIAVDATSLSYDQRADTVTASGNVVIRRGETEIKAEKVHVDRRSSEVLASGGVSLIDPAGELFADEVRFNLDEETGTLKRALVQSRSLGYSLSGDLIEKGLGQSYRIEQGKFTTCLCDEEPPSWSITGEEVEVTLGGYGRVRGGTFNILDVPVLYVPRAIFPANRERQSGFLLPRFSVSNRRGFQMLAPFYWAINRSQDLTVAADFETGARVGLVGEYRYALRRDFNGQISPSYFNESFRGSGSRAVRSGIADPSIPTDRWSVATEHTNGLGPATAYADLFLIGDDSFLREINTFSFDHARDTGIRTLPFTTSRFGVLRSWDRVAVRAQGTYYQDLVARDALTLQRLPDLETWGQIPWGDRLLARMNLRGTNFQRSEGLEGLRLDVRPEVVVPVRFGSLLFGSVRASVRETAYHLTEDQMSGGLRGDQPDAAPIDLPRNRTREVFHLRTEAGSSLSRVYGLNRFGIGKLKHTIEPLAEYIFVPGVSQDDLPVFDGEDRDNRRSLFTVGMVSRLLAKYAPDDSDEGETPEDGRKRQAASVHELARVSLTQSIDSERRIPPVTGRGDADHFSDVAFGLRVQPRPSLSLRAHTDYDTSAGDISSTSVGFRFQEDSTADGLSRDRLKARNAFGVTYRFITRSLLQQIDGSVQLRLTNTLGLLYASRVDVQNNRFLENYYGVRVVSACDCWAVDVAVVDKSNPQEVEARIQITLAGLGSTGVGPSP
jgi:LPS-assembly protein